jgi:prepilin signal peptidase PulO-like enzyme (type II secretory pathway)
MKTVMNALTLIMMMVLIFNMFFVIKITLDYMMLPNLVPLIWFIVAIPTPYFATMLTAPLLD